jgi:hypothetical protein
MGERLEPIPTIESDWGPWLKAHPGTVAYAMVPKFEPRPIPGSLLAESKETRPAPDPRLDAEDRVFGLACGDASQAWPLRSFGDRPELRAARIGDQEALVLWDGRIRTAAAFAPEIDGKPGETVTLSVDDRDPAAPWVDRETGSRWSITGRAVNGPRQGQTLRWLPGVMVKWYAWAAGYPATALEMPAEANAR